MSTPNPRRIDRRTAEYLLGWASAGTRVGHPPLAAVLTAAAVPRRPDELAAAAWGCGHRPSWCRS
jgi:hypothetical protein